MNLCHSILSTVRAFFNDDDLSKAGRVELIQIDTHTARAGVVSVDPPEETFNCGWSIRMLWAQFNSPWDSQHALFREEWCNNAAMCASQSKPIAHKQHP
jgi:hypothetical protein